jgi:PEGA domain
VALVLAIDPQNKHGRALSRLKRELARHEVVIAGSSDEALDVIDQSVPDLVIFPLLLSPGDEEALTSRLRGLSGTDQVQTLTVPLLASESSESVGSSNTNPRWFYWFRPTDGNGDAERPPHVWAKDIRAALLREREQSTAVPDPPAAVAIPPTETPEHAVAPEPITVSSDRVVEIDAKIREEKPTLRPETLTRRDLPSTIFSRFEEPSPPTEDALAPSKVAALGKALGSAIRRSGSAVARGFSAAVGAARRAAAALWGLLQRAGSLHAPGTRRLWYVTPALVLSVGGGLVVGIPRAKAWLTAEAAVGVADLQSIPDGAEVFLGKDRIGVTPVSARLPAGKHEIEFHYAGVTKTATVDVKPNQRVEVRVDWKRQPAGRLSVTSDPEGAAVTIDGMKRGFTPLTIDDLLPGQHMVTLKHANGLVQRTVRVKANETETLDVTIYSGWLALFAPIELQVSENGKPLRLNEQNQIMLSPGRHEVQLTNRALGYRESQIVEVRPGEVTAVSMTVPKTPVTVTATPSAEVWLDGVKIGETPLADFPVGLGTREFVLKSPGLGERRLMTTVTVQPSTVNVDFTKPNP